MMLDEVFCDNGTTLNRYDALCKHLAETKEKRELVIKTLESCVAEEKSVSEYFLIIYVYT